MKDKYDLTIFLALFGMFVAGVIVGYFSKFFDLFKFSFD